MKRRWLLLLWTLGVIAPAAWLARVWPPLQRAFDWFFGPPWMHVLSHALLFAVLAYLLAGIMAAGPWGKHTGRVIFLTLLWVLLVALGQEGMQLWTQSRAFTRAEWFDLGVDGAGAGAGLLLFYRGRRNDGNG
ncbi:MAG: VanZ family protein [Caldilineales bacterium]|nr:VanZ family protein [Caldilineales bacterium]